MMLKTDVEFLNEMADAILSAWAKEHSTFPEVLYHYTSAEGLTGILTSQNIWMTDLRFMNDLSELQYSSDVVRGRIKAFAERDSLSAVQKEFLSRIAQTFNRFGPGLSVYAVSFCEDGNLLSQWRAYRGKGGGYALGFDFFHTIRFLNRACVLRRVIYDPDAQISIVDGALTKFVAFVNERTRNSSTTDVGSKFLPDVCRAFSSVAGELLFTFKHPDFREEREWRLVHFANVDPRYLRDGEVPKVRSYEGNVIPYFEARFDKAVDLSRDDTLGIGFPIVDIMIGPTVNADLNIESTRLLILTLNPDFEPRIRHSGIPLRWL